MGFRIVIINSRCKLETRLNYLVVRGEKEKKIYINEINTLIVQSTAVSLTAALLSVLVENNVKIIFCDEKSNPQSELIPYYGAHNTTKRYKWQFCWGNDIKEKLWQQIIKQKIFNQSELLKRRGFDKEAQALLQYAEDVREGDSSNREGHAAKVYFNCILPIGISRHGGGFLNGCLNYGYACLLSAFNREIVAAGLLTQLGIWHDNEFNQRRYIVSVAGKACEEVFTGTSSMGSFSDLDKVSQAIEADVRALASQGFEYFDSTVLDCPAYNDALAKKVQSDLQNYYDKAKQLLIENKQLIETFVEKLKEKHYLLHSEIYKIYNAYIESL